MSTWILSITTSADWSVNGVSIAFRKHIDEQTVKARERIDTLYWWSTNCIFARDEHIGMLEKAIRELLPNLKRSCKRRNGTVHARALQTSSCPLAGFCTNARYNHSYPTPHNWNFSTSTTADRLTFPNGSRRRPI